VQGGAKYRSRECAIKAALQDSGYNPSKTRVRQRKLKKGNWVYNKNASKRLMP